ncbi:hypothetical protein ACIPPQ_20380 [Sphingopyxis sp. LARHCG72]
MTAIDNPPAFPNHPSIQIDGGPNVWIGMTLRDWFAGQLAAAEVASAGANEFAAIALSDAAEEAGQTIEERIAFNAYRVADAMLSARKDRP